MSSKDGGADLEIVKQFHDEAYIHVEQGLSLEESGQPVAAMASYEKGLRLLEQGLSPACDMPHCIGEKWDNARLLQMKMRKTKSEVLARLESLSKERGGMTCPAYEPRPQEMPPSYEEACGGGGSSNFGQGIESPTSTFGAENKNGFKSYQDLLNGMEMTDVENVTAFSEMSGGELQNIFTIADGVQIFFILPSGEVSAPCYPTALYVHRWIDANGLPLEGRNPPAFLQVGEWSFPLHPGKLPVVYTLYGAYVMPDSRAEKPGGYFNVVTKSEIILINNLLAVFPSLGSAIGILLSEDIPEEIRQMFEHLMCELTAVRKESVSCAIQEESKLSTKISNGIVVGKFNEVKVEGKIIAIAS